MKRMTRRQAMAGLGALAGSCGAGLAQDVMSAGTLGKTRVLRPGDGLTKMPNGSERWNVLTGTVATGEAVGIHYSLAPAGTAAPSLHVIHHTEMTVVMEGTLEIEHDGVKELATAGSVIYIANGTNHAVRNAGEGPARYFVMQVGGDTKKG